MYSILSRETAYHFLKKERKMSWIGAAIGAGGSLLGWGANKMTQKSDDKRQIRQQEKLTQIQEESNRRLMNEGYGLQRDMYDHTFDKNKPIEQVANLKEAGLNPALLYGIGGQGGTNTGSGGASVGGGQAANAAETSNAEANKMQQTLNHAMMSAQIKVLESQATKNEAEAGQATAETDTEEGRRQILIENMKQEGLERFLRNMEEDYKMNQGRNSHGNSEVYNPVYEWAARIEGDSYVREGMTAAIEKTLAETGNEAAKELLNNKEASAIFEKLQIEMLKAKAQGKQAENSETIAQAIKLAAEFDTGVFTNWKTWTNLGMDGINALGNIVGKVSPKGLVKEPAKALLNTKPVKGFR